MMLHSIDSDEGEYAEEGDELSASSALRKSAEGADAPLDANGAVESVRESDETSEESNLELDMAIALEEEQKHIHVDLDPHRPIEIAEDVDKTHPLLQGLEGDGGAEHSTEHPVAVEETAFGLPHVVLDDHTGPRKSSIQMIAHAAKEFREMHGGSVLNLDEEEAKSRLAKRREWWKDTLRTVGYAILFIDALYVLVMVPFRIGFYFDPWESTDHRGSWTEVLTVFSILDAIGDVSRGVFVWRSIYRKTAVASNSSKLSSATSMAASKRRKSQPVVFDRPPRRSLFSTRGSVSSAPAIKAAEVIASTAPISPSRPATTSLWLAILVVCSLPIEVVAIAINYNSLHVLRAAKTIVASYSLAVSYSRLLLKCRRFESSQWLSFSTLATPFYLCWVGLYLCHITAAGYMLLAHIECGLSGEHCTKTPIPGSWVLKDNMEQAGLWRKYVRTMYWASKTVTTLGQGDLVPATQMETNYCIIVQYISGLWATAFLASCSFYFSRRDRDIDTGVSTRLEQSLRFLQSRKVPTSLASQIRNYYQYLQRTRNGIEESQVLSNLPAHYRSQCAFFIKYRLLSKVPFFSKQPKAFLRSVVDCMESDFLSPKQTVLAMFEIIELVIVARGEVIVVDQSKAIIRMVSQEEWFGEEVIFEESRSKYEFEAKSFCEVLRLSRQLFQACMEKHFPRLKIATMMAQQKRRSAMIPTADTQLRQNSLGSFQPPGRGSGRSTLFNALHQKLLSSQDESGIAWFHPGSTFRKKWRRWKAALLIFLAIESPFEIAFEWRIGFFGADANALQQALYLVSIAVEVFFYVDWFFRVRVFARPSIPKSLRGDDSTRETTQQRSTREDLIMAGASEKAKDGLVTNPHDLMRIYWAGSNFWFDLIVNIPISIAWNFTNQSSFSIVARELMRFSRVLSMGRLVVLKETMKKIMVEIDFSPASQLLANVIVFCVITANAMACYFYLLADDKEFYNALPLGFDPSLTPVSSSQCLEQATLYGNCTWYIYDRSAFPIQARYIRSLHWSLVLLSTVGYGDILSFTNSECLIGFWWIYLGAMICYFTSCAVGSVVSQVTVLTRARDAREEEITRALVRTSVPHDVRVMIRSHYETNWDLNGSVMDEKNLMDHLPRSLQHQLASTLYVQDVRRCYLFASLGGHATMIRDIAMLLKAELFLPGSIILQHGHLASMLYMIQSGDVELLLPFDATHRFNSAMRRRSVLESQKRFNSRLVRWMYWLLYRLRPAHRRAASETSRLGGTKKSPLGIPVVALKAGDCLGEEGLLPDNRTPLRVTARALTGTQVATLKRDDFIQLAGRYPVQVRQIVTFLGKKQDADWALFETIRTNINTHTKTVEFMGMSLSVYCETKVQVNNIITPDRVRFRIWHALHGFIVLYNFYSITFRLAFLPSPARNVKIALMTLDYLMDLFLYADIYLKWNRFGYEEHGNNIVELGAIRRRYKKHWFKMDCISMVPLFYQGDFFLMSLARLPRLLKTPQLLGSLRTIEAKLRDKFMQGNPAMMSIFGLIKFLGLFLSAAHHIGSLYFLLGRILTTYGFVSTSWMTIDPVLNANPGNILVQYNRAIYWCLETFTVVCFGDVVSRSAPETIFASFTCIMGWMCIGQVVGRITSLMANIDKESSEHNARVDNFEQFARDHELPQHLRERAIESTEYQSKCIVELSLRSTFQDLPPALHAMLFDELYGPLVRQVPEFSKTMTSSQLRVLADALTLRLFVTDDLILEEGRLGLHVYIMKEGRAEYYSAALQLVFAPIYEGQIFGDVAFFQPGERHALCVRASRSCQVLELSHRVWMELWDETSRSQLEAKLLVQAKAKQESISRAHANIATNLKPVLDPSFSTTDEVDDEDRVVSRAVFDIMTLARQSRTPTTQHRSSTRGYTSIFSTLKKKIMSAVPNKVTPAFLYSSSRLPKKKTAVVDAGSRHKLRRSLGISLGVSLRTIAVATSARPGGNVDAALVHPVRSAYTQHLALIKARFQRRQVNKVFQMRKTTTVDLSSEDVTHTDVWVEPPPPQSFCLESSRFRRVWNGLMYFSCLYYVLVVPFRVSFSYEYLSSPDSLSSVQAWFVFEYFIDALCILDFFLSKNYFTFVNRGTLITESHLIRDHYLREGTYLVDLLCILPFELLLPFAPLEYAPGTMVKVTWYRVAVCRINKMARIAHLHELGDKLQRLVVYDMKLSSVRASAIYFIRFAFDFALGAHWVACMFYGATFNAIDTQYASWLTAPGMLTFEGRVTEQEVGAVPWQVKYARSYHFSMGAITTVSYGDIAPQNAWETFVTTFVIITSIVLFGMLSGGFNQLFEMEMGTRADYEEKISSVAHFMMFHKFPARIWRHMQSYFMVHWSESQGMNEEELLSGLPTSVKDDITLYVKQDFIQEMKLFAGCDESFVRAVVAAFDQELFVRNDVIITYGDRGRSLYVIEYGNVLVRIPQGPIVEASQAGTRTSVSVAADVEVIKGRLDFFGEKSLIFDIPRSATCIALSSCSMLILTVDKYEAIIQHFPEYREKNMRAWIFSAAEKRTRAANAIRRLPAAAKTMRRGAQIG